MLRRINQSKKIMYISMALIFLVVLIFNILTPLFLDDFTYLNSFATGKRITSIIEIFNSMKAHYQVQNGRIVVHFFSQLFLLLPPIVFDVINSFMFVLQIALIYFYCKAGQKENVFLLFVIVAFIWKFVPAFGQVYLWLSGACNYLWSATFCLLYIFPFIVFLQGNTVLKRIWSQVLYALIGGFVGACLESTSFGSLTICLLCIVLVKVYRKEKAKLWMIFSVIAQSFGYIFMLISPASKEYKVATGWNTYLHNFLTVLEKYKEVALWLFLLWIVLIIFCSYIKIEREILIRSLVCAFISLILNFIHIGAAYYVERSMLGSILFLIMAICHLLFALWNMKYEMISTCIGAVIILLAMIDFFPGVYDIASTYREYKAREYYIEEQKEKGILELELDAIWPETKYSGVWGIRELDTKPDVRPNTTMAQYYGVNEIKARE